ncbi:hypothetical protein K9U39_10980 [Rhodoblastus acidophilus]|uniref:DUF3168 domain-containing protein n=1 Tax=Candidatus Rhodoblastus alkanivorans TaxID=2954117 RepID=A0ABS9Z9V6_9HYPH|nr:hypothetical protein [Candidatus Rhodoblastus alkanivorans]MCI4680178.1 hypothetical protein [Candidatus Rhodoblastus alkanivorans]MCI4684135.1 hypothetical protein [Candidatus Rhodoblastus alkanivorans]MDI4641455.1 hypothetical protein [Rhodoblastus acidophilus]
MTNTREAIMAALCACLAKAQFATPINGCDTWAMLSRRVKLWSDVAAADQPALFVGEHGENVAYAGDSFPSKTTLNVDLLIYTSAGRDPDSTPARDLNVAIEALIATLAPDPKIGRQTLGGLVQSCRVEGRVIKDPGDLDGQGFALVPVKILIP